VINGSLRSSHDRQIAADAIARGEVVAAFNRGVNALWLDGAQPEAVAKMQSIKGERRGLRPVGLTLSADKFAPMIDSNGLSPELGSIVCDPNVVRGLLGSLCFIRAPIKDSYRQQLPNAALSIDAEGRAWAQNWDPWGHRPTVHCRAAGFVNQAQNWAPACQSDGGLVTGGWWAVSLTGWRWELISAAR